MEGTVLETFETASIVKRRYILSKSDTILVIFSVVLLIGVLAGATTVKNIDEGTFEVFSSIFLKSQNHRVEMGIGKAFLSVFMSQTAVLMILFTAGFCAIGFPIIPIIPFLKGLNFGAVSAYLYLTHGIGAVKYIVLGIFPEMLISSVIVTLGCRESLKLSLSYFLTVCKGIRDDEIKYKTGYYCARYLVMFLATAVSALAEALLLQIY